MLPAPLYHVLAYVAAGTVLGMVWYSPLMFGSPWMRLKFPGRRPEEISPGALPFVAAWFGNGVVASAMFCLLHEWLAVRGLEASLKMAATVAAIVVGSQLPHAAFNGTPATLLLIDHGYDIVCLLSYAVILALIG